MGKKKKMAYFLTILYMVRRISLKHYYCSTMVCLSWYIPSELLIGTMVPFQNENKVHQSSDNYRALTLCIFINKLYDAIIIKQQIGVLAYQICNLAVAMAFLQRCVHLW